MFCIKLSLADRCIACTLARSGHVHAMHACGTPPHWQSDGGGTARLRHTACHAMPCLLLNMHSSPSAQPEAGAALPPPEAAADSAASPAPASVGSGLGSMAASSASTDPDTISVGTCNQRGCTMCSPRRLYSSRLRTAFTAVAMGRGTCAMEAERLSPSLICGHRRVNVVRQAWVSRLQGG